MHQEDSEEQLILVDEHDNPIGQMGKEACHDGSGHRHRAFSVWVMDEQDRILVQKRAAQKRLWPDYWSNTCCSHPNVGETTNFAVKRRLQQELQMQVRDLNWHYSFNYQRPFENAGSENEHCHVYLATVASKPEANLDEISDLRWLTFTELDRDIHQNADQWTPWCKLEWEELKQMGAISANKQFAPLS
jgi:isopentenyl-diphosphate delta-isomerase